jgi:hypothetical protein
MMGEISLIVWMKSLASTLCRVSGMDLESHSCESISSVYEIRRGFMTLRCLWEELPIVR